MEIAYAVFLLNLHQLAAHLLIIAEETLHFLRILRRDVCLAEYHKVVDVVAGVEEQTAHGGVGHFFLNQRYRAHMQLHKFLHIFHLLVHRKLHPFEDAGYHFFAHEVVVVECPPVLLVILLGDWLGDVVEQRCPAKPFLVRLFSHRVEHLHRVQEIVFMSAPVFGLDALQGVELREYKFEQSAFFQKHEPH